MEALKAETDDSNKAVIARELAKIPATDESKQAFKKAYESIAIDAEIPPAGSALESLTEAAGQFFDSSLVDWLLVRAAKTKGSDDDKKSLQLAITVTALKLAKPDQMPQVKVAVDKYGTKLEKRRLRAGRQPAQGLRRSRPLLRHRAAKGENQDRAKQFVGIKAGYMIGILGDEQSRDEVVKGIDSVTNAALRSVSATVIDHLSPKGSKDVAAKLNAVIEKNAKSPDREKSAGDSPLKQVMYRLGIASGLSRTAAMSSLRLEVATGVSAGRVFEAELDVVRIGRGESNDLVLTDALISSEHARIVSSSDGFVLEDLESTNGTWLLRAGERHALGEGRRAIALSAGDRLLLGGPDSEGIELRLDFTPDTDTLEIALLRPLSELGKSAPLVAGDDRLQLLVQALREVVSHEGVSEVVSGIADAALLLVPRATHATVVLRQDADSGQRGQTANRSSSCRWSRAFAGPRGRAPRKLRCALHVASCAR
ncbi:MAG: FHA domain-containing protein [Pseudomonadota bacterium]